MASNDFINLLVYRGDDSSIALKFKTPDHDPIDITGWIISFSVKEKTYHSDADDKILIDVTTHADPVNGITGFVIPHALTDSLFGVYQYDIQYKTNLNIRKTFARGQIEFFDDCSRR
jgi:hypothetical protein